MKKYLKVNAGFTLVEILASVIVLVAIGSIISGIITSSLRVANKTNTVETIRSNGDYALSQFSKDVQYALPFDGDNTGLWNNVAGTYDIGCLSTSLTPTPTPYDIISVESMNDSAPKKYVCRTREFSRDGNSLVDTNAVIVESCSLTCFQANIADVPIIKISFKLKSVNSGLAENSGSTVFETSVTLKNYEK